jgi:hypothetical protein
VATLIVQNLLWLKVKKYLFKIELKKGEIKINNTETSILAN